jgi:hypothetical protein
MKRETALNARGGPHGSCGPHEAPQAPAPFPADPWCPSVDADLVARGKALNHSTIFSSYRVAIRYLSSTNELTATYRLAISCIADVYLVANG